MSSRRVVDVLACVAVLYANVQLSCGELRDHPQYEPALLRHAVGQPYFASPPISAANSESVTSSSVEPGWVVS